jgi:ammonia channel protein AmtB
MNAIQSISRRSLRIGVVAAVVAAVAAFAPAAGASHPYSGVSLGAYGSANAVEHRLLSHRDLGVDDSVNSVEHRLLSRQG